MYRLFFLLMSGLWSLATFSQGLSAKELLSLSSMPGSRFEQAINKKGFTRSDNSYISELSAAVYQQAAPKDSVKREAERIQEGKVPVFIFRTSCSQEAGFIMAKLEKEGFELPGDTSHSLNKELIYQRRNSLVLVSRTVDSRDTVFTFRFQDKQSLVSEKIEFAEDLLQFNSHQKLAIVFGEGNVSKDMYYFTENNASPCTVIFPHTARQAIFIWKDVSTLSDLSQVIVGGGLHVGDDIRDIAHVAENEWTLKNGVHANMSLHDLLDLNKSDFNIYGKSSKYYMMVTPAPGTILSTAKTHVVMGCFNCAGSPTLSKPLVSADALSREGLSMHVQMLILTPEDNIKK